MNRTVAEVFPPGEFIKDELDARGWTQRDLAEILGRSEPKVSELINGRRLITTRTAKELAAAFDTSAEVWLNLETAYQLWKDQDSPDAAVARRSRLYELAPVKDMARRGWIESSSSIDTLEQQIEEFFEIDSVDETPRLLQVASRQSASYAKPTPAQAAWLYRVLQMARAIDALAFRKSHVGALIKDLRGMMANAEDVRGVPGRLAEAGIRLVLLEHLPRTKLDGATVWPTAQEPVVAVSTRYDRIDHFWFTLMHELAHVAAGDGKKNQWLLDNDLADQSSEGALDRPKYELDADRVASENLVPRKAFEKWANRVGPYYTAETIRDFAARLGVHPGIVVGQIHHREQNYSQFRQYLVKVRQFLAQSAISDGWGRPVSIRG